MKQWIMLAGFITLVTAACNQRAENRFLDLRTGEYVELKKDSATGRMVNAETGEPVEIYVNSEKDTIWGADGTVINGRVVQAGDGKWKYEGAESGENQQADQHAARNPNGYKIKNGDYKKEVEKDGDITIKDGDRKIKIDGETGERKVKKDD